MNKEIIQYNVINIKSSSIHKLYIYTYAYVYILYIYNVYIFK